MFWLFLAAAFFISGIVDAIKNREGAPIVLGFLVSLVVMAFGAICCAAIGMCIPADEVYETNNKQICAISDNTGTFFVGRYGAKSSTFYCYLEETENGGKVMKEVKVSDATLYDDKTESPYVSTLKKRNSNPIIRFFFWTYRDEYDIHIPRGSIKYNFNVDLE